MALIHSIATVGGYTMISRVLGFVRDILIAAFLGAGPVADAFFVAFKFPNLFRHLFAEGAFNAAFVPLFARHMSEEGRVQARKFTEEILSVFVVALLLFVTILQIAMPWIMHGLAPGFSADGSRFALAVTFAQITFPYLLFISIVSQLGGVLNALGRFAAAAAAPILLNLCLIGALLSLSSLLQTPGHALAWGVMAGGVVQLLWLMAACRRANFELRLLRPRVTPRVKRLLGLMLPGAIGAGVVQINLLVDILIGSLLPLGSISFLYYSDRVSQLPLGVIGVAVGTALLPLLAQQLRSNNEDAATHTLNRAVEFALLLAVPASAALIIIPDPIIKTLFERGGFAADETRATAAALVAYATGLPAFILIKVLAPGFFARENTVTPVKIAGLCVLLNVGLNLLLMGPLLHVGIALATAISAWVNAGFLFLGLHRRGYFKADAQLKRALPRILLASGTMVAVVWVSFDALINFIGTEPVPHACALGLVIVIGGSVFGVSTMVFGIAKMSDIKRMLDRSSS